MAEYRFLTTWLLDAPIAAVWDVIHDVEAWPEWWHGVRSVTKLEEGDEAGVGAVYDHRWRSVLPYTVSFTTRVRAIEKPFLIEAEANGGLVGIGRWRLYEGSGTAATYEWNVRTTREWMNALAPVAGPVFAWNHHAIMRRGGAGIAKRLGCTLQARG